MGVDSVTCLGAVVFGASSCGRVRGQPSCSFTLQRLPLAGQPLVPEGRAPLSPSFLSQPTGSTQTDKLLKKPD